MNKLFVGVILLALAGCNEKSQKENVDAIQQNNPECRVTVTYSNGTNFYVVKCPNRTTTVQYETGGKHSQLIHVTSVM